MSKFNVYAHDPASIDTTRAWLQQTAPLVYLFGPSGAGKTTLLGSLFRHPLYHRVLVIDVDQGTTTIGGYTQDKSICDFHEFDKFPSQRLGWFREKLRYARTADVGAIVIEGLTSIHAGMVSDRMEDVSDPDGPAAMRAHIAPTNQTATLIESLRALKQYRKAGKKGVPIVVTLNTRLAPVSPNDLKDMSKKTVPDWSPNLTDKAMRTADAFIEVPLRGSDNTSRMLTLPTPDNSARKFRAPVPLVKNDASKPNAAIQVQRETNLDLPGMFALWAQAIAMHTPAQDILAAHAAGEPITEAEG